MEWFEIKINNTVFAYLLRTKWIHYMINLIILLVWPWLHGVQPLSWKPPGRVLEDCFFGMDDLPDHRPLLLVAGSGNIKNTRRTAGRVEFLICSGTRVGKLIDALPVLRNGLPTPGRVHRAYADDKGIILVHEETQKIAG